MYVRIAFVVNISPRNARNGVNSCWKLSKNMSPKSPNTIKKMLKFIEIQKNKIEVIWLLGKAF